jgi:hypothetical protein
VLFSYPEFKVAFKKAQANHPTISEALGEAVMKNFVERWENNQAKHKTLRLLFHEIIRLSLNELKIKPNDRQMYSALIGFYYSSHAVYVNQRKARTPKTATPRKKAIRTSAPVNIVTDGKGQLAWEI